MEMILIELSKFISNIDLLNDNTANILVWTNLNDLRGTVEYLSGAFQKPILIRSEQGKLIEDINCVD